LRERAVALGWARERIVVVDGDQGQSGASAADRVGFQTLVMWVLCSAWRCHVWRATTATGTVCWRSVA
jgi:hypothetical protein